MAEIDPSETAPEVKSNCPNPQPVFKRGEMYLLSDLREYFSKATIAAWRSAGLRVCQPGTHRAFVFSDDLFDLFQRWEGTE